jgi:hypothetical protein
VTNADEKEEETAFHREKEERRHAQKKEQSLSGTRI